MNDFAQAVREDKQYDLSYLGLKLTVKHPKGRPAKLMVSPSDDAYTPIELTEASSGIQTSTPLSVIVQHFAKDYSFKNAFRRSVLDYLYDNELLTKFSPRPNRPPSQQKPQQTHQGASAWPQGSSPHHPRRA